LIGGSFMNGPLTLVLLLSMALCVFSADKERPKSGSIAFGSKNKLTASVVEAKNTSKAFVEVAKFVKPAVVSVTSTKIMKTQMNQLYGAPFDFFFGPQQRPNQPQQPQEKEYRQEGLGSGVIVSSDGYILTNNHVVEDADEITVTLFDKKEVDAEVVGADKESDVAVLKLKENFNSLPVALLGNSDNVEVGEWVLAVGNPFSKKLSHTVTAGIVSAKGRSTNINTYENFIQTDASINPGNSGGALVNLQGEVIGINTAIMSRSGGNIGIGFAIPINMARKVMEDLIYVGKVSRGWLGIEMQPLEKDLGEALGLKSNNGVLVKEVLKDSPAEKGGIKTGDVITEVEDIRIDGMDELKNLIGNMAPNTEVAIKLIRDKKEKKLKIKLAERNPEALGGFSPGTNSDEDIVGLQVQPINSALMQKYGLSKEETGMVVVNVKSKSPAFNAELREGDIIKKINTRAINNADDYREALKGVKAGQSLLFYVKRDRTTFYVGVKIKDSKE